MLEPRTALSVSMILHELITNASKYGALSGQAGRISLRWEVEQAEDLACLVLRWRETGVLIQEPPRRAGFGSKMIEACARHDLRGKAIAQWHEDGVEYVISFPAATQIANS